MEISSAVALITDQVSYLGVGIATVLGSVMAFALAYFVFKFGLMRLKTFEGFDRTRVRRVAFDSDRNNGYNGWDD